MRTPLFVSFLWLIHNSLNRLISVAILSTSFTFYNVSKSSKSFFNDLSTSIFFLFKYFSLFSESRTSGPSITWIWCYDRPDVIELLNKLNIFFKKIEVERSLKNDSELFETLQKAKYVGNMASETNRWNEIYLNDTNIWQIYKPYGQTILPSADCGVNFFSRLVLWQILHSCSNNDLF